jgi:DHA1 family bicyclomycin/chloramphenicol resistance-like MFS transporter
MLSAIGPMSTDMYLPAFPAIEAGLNAGPGSVQITLAAYFLGLAVGQITQGTLSDRYGRRWPLAIGMVIYTLATIGCALTPSLLGLSIMRGLSAFGGSASGVITRAIVRDLADGHAAARIMSKMMLVMGVAPIMAPTVGSLVLGVWGWQAIFWVCAAYGGICLIGVLLLLPETLPVFIRTFGLAPSSYGIMFGACASGFILASQINPRLLHRFGTQAISRVSMRVMLVATLVMTTISFAGYATWPLVAVCVLFAMSSQGFTMPNATVGALARHAAHAGSASALMGTLQFALAGVSGLLVGLLEDGTARPMAGLMFLGALGANIAEWYRPKVKA